MQADSPELSASDRAALKEQLKQLRPGDTFVVTIERFDGKYLGETKLPGKTVMVPGTMPGETVRGVVLRNWRKRLLLRPIEILNADPDRVEPRCQHFSLCAGCQFQHISYERQLAIKRERLEGFFPEDHPLHPLPLRAVLPSPKPYGYRNSIKVHGPGEPGFWQVKGIDMLRNQECPICVEGVEASLQEMRRQHFSEFVDRDVLNILIRGTSIGQTYVGPEQPKPEEIAWLAEALENPLTGETLQLVVPAHAFWQASTPMLPTLIAEVVRPVAAFAPEVLLEAYCGMGLFGIMCAPLVPRAIGIEEHPLAIEAARRNQKALDLTNLEIVEGKTEDCLGAYLEELPLERSTLVVDPPRSGLPKKVLKQILARPPKQLVYVSCNPDSFAQNLRQLCPAPYAVRDLIGLDLFPQTKHLECLGVLERVDAAA